MSPTQLTVPGVLGYSKEAYNGKLYTGPEFDPACDPVVLVPNAGFRVDVDPGHDLIRCFNRPYDLREFLRPRLPIVVGEIPLASRAGIHAPGLVRVLDLAIKLPRGPMVIPRALRQIAPAAQTVLDAELALNPARFDDYYCYLTVDQAEVDPDDLQREAPVHVDGFQGSRWNPKHPVNHTYTVGSHLPTVFYPIPFDFVGNGFDVARHDAYWEMNAVVADDNSARTWQPRPWEIVLMDGYCGHRGVEAEARVFRTWLRFSFETRIFDRLGNPHLAHLGPFVPRDIEQLGLVAFRPDGDPSLRVFPWQGLDGKPLPPGAPKTKPNLRPRG